jgi:CelD/BcsL family acetyltransferase involved in cellulose biosynthesis
MELSITIIKDNKVFELLKNQQFLDEWKRLSEKDNKVTVIQEPAFVCTWYLQYRRVYSPVLVLGYDQNDQLVGLMPLAISLQYRYLTHAGDEQAEYHGWISEEKFDQEFPIQALVKIKNELDLREWQWRCIPPKANTNWLYSKHLAREKVYINSRTLESPILTVTNKAKVGKINANKSIKTKMNRFKKRGDFNITRITDKQQANKLFDTLAKQTDLRQQIIHQVAPFTVDKNKKQFFVERMNYPQDNHFTVLWSNDNPIAFHFGACDSDTVYLGLSSFDIQESKNSPGTLHLIKFIEMIEKEGYKYFDLTPGGDQYKERFSDDHQELVQPTYYFSRTKKIN